MRQVVKVTGWALVGTLLALAGCGPSAEPEPPVEVEAAPSDDPGAAERHAALRERLREDLGELYDEPLPAASDDQLVQGERHWELLCSNCHGRKGGGTRQLSQMLPIVPGDLRDPERAIYFSQRAKLAIITDGIAGTPMIGWKDLLNESELRGVLAHLETLVVSDE